MNKETLTYMQTANEQAIPGSTAFSKACARALAVVTANGTITLEQGLLILQALSAAWVEYNQPSKATTLEDTLSDIRITE